MMKITLITVLLFIAANLQIAAQQKEKISDNGQEKTEVLSKEQKDKVKAILSDYDSSSLTAKDAQAIHEAFREAGLRGGPAAEEAIKEAGFNPDKLRDLAPKSEIKNDNLKAAPKDIQTKNKNKKGKTGFSLKSSGINEDGSLMKNYTGDGKGVSFPLEWTNVPKGTKYFALNLWHYPQPTDPTEVKSYWVLYNIPANVSSLLENVNGIGQTGYNDKDNNSYDPMKSKGPGVKEYNLTIYALSAKPKFNTSKVYRADLLKAIEGITLDECTLTYTYERGSGSEAGLTLPPNEELNNKPDRPERGGDNLDQKRYSIEQAISDRAQLTTIAFSGLAFITGDFGASTFIPPGKVCDYFGFQYMRDIDVAEKGHNPMFVDRVVGNVLYILNDKQKQMFRDLADEQVPQLEALAEMRLPLIKSFHKELDGDIPKGSDGLNKQSVKKYVGEIFEQDAKLSIRRAEVLAAVANSLTEKQKAYLGEMKFGDFNTWPDKNELAHLDKDKSKLYNVAYMTYASEFFSWYAGSIEADTYICPERQGTYFGGFYMKDIPAMDKRDFDISTSITGDSGETFLNDVLNSEQQKYITGILDSQHELLKEVIEVRRAFSTELRKLLDGQQPDPEKLLSLGHRYGELDGELSWNYATAYAKLNQTLTDEQREELMELRNLDGYESAPYYIYSSPANKQPVLKNVDTFFFTPKQE